MLPCAAARGLVTGLEAAGPWGFSCSLYAGGGGQEPKFQKSVSFWVRIFLSLNIGCNERKDNTNLNLIYFLNEKTH